MNEKGWSDEIEQRDNNEVTSRTAGVCRNKKKEKEKQITAVDETRRKKNQTMVKK